MERMAGYNFYIRREMLLERGQLWGLARGLATDNRTDLGRWAIFRHYLVDNSSLYTVYNKVAYS